MQDAKQLASIRLHAYIHVTARLAEALSLIVTAFNDSPKVALQRCKQSMQVRVGLDDTGKECSAPLATGIHISGVQQHTSTDDRLQQSPQVLERKSVQRATYLLHAGCGLGDLRHCGYVTSRLPLCGSRSSCYSGLLLGGRHAHCNLTLAARAFVCPVGALGVRAVWLRCWPVSLPFCS